MATPSEGLDEAALADLRHRFEPSVRTHWDDCYKDHAFCAVVRLCDELTAARQRIAELEDAATIYGAVMVQADGLEADLRARIAELEGERRKVVPAYQDACGRLYLGTTHAQALEAAEALGAVIPDDSCGGWLMSDGTYLPQHPATPAAREGAE